MAISKSENQNVKPVALVIDDEAGIRTSLAGVLSDEGWKVEDAPNGLAGIKLFTRNRPDIVFLDIWMPGIDGIETLQKLKERDGSVPVVIMSGHGTIDTAVRATRLGAYEYLEKPLSIDKIIPILDHAKNIMENTFGPVLSGQAKDSRSSFDILGDSEEIQEIRERVALVAPKNAWVLITGENGSGKEILSRMIHQRSDRFSGPFVAMNCAAIPEELIESELFGHEKGSFTGASARKKGKFELANLGTIFLDEIGDMSLRTQAKVLRVLQEQSFERVGGHETISVDVRVIAATNKSLADLIKKGEFREDLFYRLNVVPFHIPPLRERRSDIPLLINHFLKVMGASLGEEKQFSDDALSLLKRYDWPGNVRELKNLIERVLIMCPGSVVDSEKIRPFFSSVLSENDVFLDPAIDIATDSNVTLKEARGDFEKMFIMRKLEECEWNVSRTAEAIGIERSNLHKKLRQYGIDAKQLRQ